MEIVIAREVGYCYGVRDAVGMAVREAEKAGGAKVYTLGPVIHNQHTIDMLCKEHTVHTVNSVEEVGEPGATVLIRTHGTTPAKVRELEERGLGVQDATCPFVLKTQCKARDMAAEGYHVVILGHRDHPEVVGIAGQVPGGCTIISKKEDLDALDRRGKVAVLFQSTVAVDDYRWAIAEIAGRCHEMRIFQTVCGVTITRQKRTEEVARGVDAMIVIGGRHSSNTRKLVEISGKYCKTHHIEEPEEVDAIDFAGVRRVGISTGTSTPDFLVDKVVERLKAKA